LEEDPVATSIVKMESIKVCAGKTKLPDKDDIVSIMDIFLGVFKLIAPYAKYVAFLEDAKK
jgi:hypothetical protein